MSLNRLAYRPFALVVLRIGIHDLEYTIAGGTAGLEYLVELVQATDRLIEITNENKKCDQCTNFHSPTQNLSGSKSSYHKQSGRRQKLHAWLVERPSLHHGESFLPHLVTRCIKAYVLPFLTCVGLDLANAGNVVVKERVELRNRLALTPVT